MYRPFLGTHVSAARRHSATVGRPCSEIRVTFVKVRYDDVGLEKHSGTLYHTFLSPAVSSYTLIEDRIAGKASSMTSPSATYITTVN